MHRFFEPLVSEVAMSSASTVEALGPEASTGQNSERRRSTIGNRLYTRVLTHTDSPNAFPNC